MRRREFITLLGGAVVTWPLAARAQQPGPLRRIAVLINLSEADRESQARTAALRDGLRKLGWVQGRNIQIESRYASGNPELGQRYAAELVASRPEVIFAGTTMPLVALQGATRTIPIVFAQVADPVATGFVESNSHPGGNITGFAQFEFSIASQWVDLLKQIAPSLTRVAILYDPANTEVPGFLAVIDAAARVHAVKVASFQIRNRSDIEHDIETFAREPNGGLIPLPGPLMATERDLIISLSVRHGLPNLFAQPYYPATGGLASYGADNIDLYRRAADYVDRILKGEKPADLPIQFPTKYQLVLNLKTAKALGLEVPTTLLVRADEVIE